MADITITPGNVVKGANAKTRTGRAGGTITAGMPVYSDASDNGDFKAAQADAATTDAVVGIALHGASDGQPLTIVYEDDALNLGATLTVGQVYVLSAAAAGGIAPYSDLLQGDFVTVLGVATTAALLRLRINVSSVAKP